MRSVGAPFAAWLMNSLNPAEHTAQAMASPDYASVIAPAPVIYAAWLAVGAAVEYVSASSLLPFRIGVWVAVVLILIAIAIVVSAFRALARAQTAFDARKSTTKIVNDGAFRFSRNPTYLSLSMLHIGIAFAFGSSWLLLTVIPAVAITQWGVIRREERYLEAKFGDGYRRYALTARRWL